MRTKPELKVTHDYTMFELHEVNRPLHVDPVLEASMKKHGFLPSCAISVEKVGGGRLKVKRGHHRLDCAKRLGLPVWYIIDNSQIDIHELESPRQAWTRLDFAISRASCGDKDVQRVLDFHRKHGLPLGISAGLLGGNVGDAGGHALLKITEGTFRVADDLSHAKRVVAVTDRCREMGLSCATHGGFATAISMLLVLQEFDANVFLHRVSLNKGRMSHRSNTKDYLDEIEAVYNFGSKKPMPLAFLAKEALKSRRAAATKRGLAVIHARQRAAAAAKEAAPS